MFDMHTGKTWGQVFGVVNSTLLVVLLISPAKLHHLRRHRILEANEYEYDHPGCNESYREEDRPSEWQKHRKYSKKVQTEKLNIILKDLLFLPESTLINVFQILKYIPPWVPGATTQKFARA